MNTSGKTSSTSELAVVLLLDCLNVSVPSVSIDAKFAVTPTAISALTVLKINKKDAAIIVANFFIYMSFTVFSIDII